MCPDTYICTYLIDRFQKIENLNYNLIWIFKTFSSIHYQVRLFILRKSFILFRFQTLIINILFSCKVKPNNILHSGSGSKQYVKIRIDYIIFIKLIYKGIQGQGNGQLFIRPYLIMEKKYKEILAGSFILVVDHKRKLFFGIMFLMFLLG